MLNLYSSGRTNGLVVDCGEGSTNAVPVYEGFVINNAVKRNLIAGKAITEYFVTLMSQEDGATETSGGSSWNQTCKKIKE